MLFLLRTDKSRCGKLFGDMRKLDFVGIYEYPETINGAYELLVRTSRQFGGSILRGGRRYFRNEHGHGDRTSVMFMQTRGDQGENNIHQGATRLREIKCQGNMDSYTVTLSVIHAIVMDILPINDQIKTKINLSCNNLSYPYTKWRRD